jgi:hypothetical protein
MAALEAQTPQILPGTFTVDQLPSPEPNLGKYARVTDLFGTKTDLVLSSKSGSLFFWQPVRPDYSASLAADQNVTLTCLKTPSFIKLTGGLTAARTFTLSTQMAYPGASFDIAMAGTLGLFGLTIAGLSLGSTLSMLANGRRRVYFDGTAWQSFT